MQRSSAVAVGLLMIVIGGIWTFQGLGYLTGSPMTGIAIWAVVGPLVAGLGIALILTRRGKS